MDDCMCRRVVLIFPLAIKLSCFIEYFKFLAFIEKLWHLSGQLLLNFFYCQRKFSFFNEIVQLSLFNKIGHLYFSIKHAVSNSFWHFHGDHMIMSTSTHLRSDEIWNTNIFTFFDTSVNEWFRSTAGSNATVTTKQTVGILLFSYLVQHTSMSILPWFAGKDNIEIAFMYSQCGEDWKQVKLEIGPNMKWMYNVYGVYLPLDIRWRAR